ncbi:Trithorax-related 4 [Hyphodiscus hymeniophilus]|uniref:Trithorax-related 4 n=1 Tax=Hyphodiscus hymeniophilus TaxID=353542 RepID=A0A9P7B074_9HELO|nr:Trithorax-related 4 [Hyphodiscus hymeniophilus]
MDSPWRAALYSPSSACEVATYQFLEPEQLESEIKDLAHFTKSISLTPYDPELWLNRAHCLRLLGYPELGLGDAYKARLLVEATLETPGSTLGTNALQTFAKKIYIQHMTDPAWSQWKSRVSTSALLKARSLDMLKRLEAHIWTELMEGLIASNCCGDYLKLSKEAVLKFPDDEVFPSDVANAESWYQQRVDILQAQVDEGDMTVVQMQTTLDNGGVYPTPYPWMTEALLVRDDNLIQSIKEEFTLASTNCTVFKSTLRNAKEMTEFDVLGVIASKDISSEDTVVIDRTPAGAISNVDRCEACCAALPSTKTTIPCCSALYCSEQCSETALQNYHTSVCGKDFAFLHDAAKSADHTADFSLDALLLLRVLALSLQEDATHPLQTSIIQRLTPAYSMPEPQLIIFNFADHIVTPILTLRELGVDIFSNPLYDTWVLHTMRCRIQNNKHGATLDEFVGSAISPLYSMFNHSCSPNVDWRHDDYSSTVTLFATRDIKEGEEMCISYIKGAEMGRKERQRALLTWLGMECGCQRCTEEKALEKNTSDEDVESGRNESGGTGEQHEVKAVAEQLDHLRI